MVLLLILGLEVAADSTAPAALEAIRSREAAIQNFSERTVWRELSAGQLKAVEEITMSTDDLGRYRLTVERATYDDAGAQRSITRQWRLNDGELIVTFDEKYNPYDLHSGGDVVPRDGSSPSPALTAPPDFQPHPMAYIYDVAGNPALQSVKMVRSPLTFLADQVRWALELAEKASGDAIELRIEPHRDGPSSRHLAHFSHGGIDYSATFDASRGWIVLSVESKGGNGRILSESAADYSEVAPGIWLPSKGFIRKWDPALAADAPPVLDWSFASSTLAVNAPDFRDEEAFGFRLEAGTAVYDHRFDVHYIVGEQPAFSGNISALAERARATVEAAKQARAEKLPEDRSAHAPPKRWLVVSIANVVLLISLATFFLLRRRMRS